MRLLFYRWFGVFDGGGLGGADTADFVIVLVTVLNGKTREASPCHCVVDKLI